MTGYRTIEFPRVDVDWNARTISYSHDQSPVNLFVGDELTISGGPGLVRLPAGTVVVTEETWKTMRRWSPAAAFYRVRYRVGRLVAWMLGQ